MRSRIGPWVLSIVVAGLVGGACSDGAGPQDSSATHFLEECSGACAGGLECICGVCTRACVAENDCSPIGARATCVDTSVAAPSCRGVGPAHVCDTLCASDANCTGLAGAPRCTQAHCRPPARASEAPDSSPRDSSLDSRKDLGGTGGTHGSNEADAARPGAHADGATSSGGAATTSAGGSDGSATRSNGSGGLPLAEAGATKGGSGGVALEEAGATEGGSGAPSVGAVGHTCVTAGDCLSRCCAVQPGGATVCSDARVCAPPCLAAGSRPCAPSSGLPGLLPCCAGSYCISDSINQICLPFCTTNAECATGCCAIPNGNGVQVCADPAFCGL